MNNGENNTLLSYIEQSLSNNFTKTATLKQDEASLIELYKHNASDKKIIKRSSTNRNDDIFRLLKNKKIPHLVQIEEVCSDDAKLVVLEEFIDGTNLAKKLEQGTIPQKEACKYTLQICKALNQLHALGIIHRDIKPSNIIITNDDNAVLIDLSIARLVSVSDADTDNLGTVGYAAPEQFGLTQSTPASDIYSLCITLNIMLTGVHPALQMPKGAIKYIISKATSTNISKRYSNIAQLEHQLKIFSL